MSVERFPVKERRGTDLDSQLAWLVREMGYSRDKVKGYEEKLIRLGRDPSDATSVFGFMSNYWKRFRRADSLVDEFEEPRAVSSALQANAKVVAGLSDKVAFALWLRDKSSEKTSGPEALLDTALEMIRGHVGELVGVYDNEELLAMTRVDFGQNPMGQAILGLHESFERKPNDIDTLLFIALEGSAHGVLMWQAYARSLESRGFSVKMPAPGLPSGTLEPWN